MRPHVPDCEDVGGWTLLQTFCVTLEDPKRVLTTGSFRVLQCNPRQKPFVAFGNVPVADSHDFEDIRGDVLEGKAAVQIAGSNSLS